VEDMCYEIRRAEACVDQADHQSGNRDGPGADARFHEPVGITVDPAGNVVVVDRRNHALRLVSKAGAVQHPCFGCLLQNVKGTFIGMSRVA
jgi:hypothetical protein